MAVNNVSGSASNFAPNPAPRAEAPRPRAGAENLFANDAWFAADSDLPTAGDPVGNGVGGGGPVVDREGRAPGGRWVGGSAANDPEEEDGRGGFSRVFHRMFSGSGSGS